MRSRNLGLIVFILLLVVGLLVYRNSNRHPVEFVRDASHMIYTKHARCRMDCRHIDETEIKEILENGTINYEKSEPDGKPDPKYAVEGTTRENQRLRIIFAPTNRGMVVITCIDLEKDWYCNCQ
ncbi:MAG: hypothetical protein C5B52_15865 [Bacteroidetes bacterium]|nr:MAG: hypothetical protein C5B52_15865 [Bacteroidota bacterium]